MPQFVLGKTSTLSLDQPIDTQSANSGFAVTASLLGGAAVYRCDNWGLAHPFLISILTLILEGAPLLSRLLRQGGDFDLHELRVPSSSSLPCPCKKRRDKDGAAAGGRPTQARFLA